MSMKQIAFVTAILVLSVFGETASASDDEGLAAALRQVVEQNLLQLKLRLTKVLLLHLV